MKISVLIPVFNREQFLEESINSVLEQTYTDLDIIVYDDGSTDGSVEIVKNMMEEDKRIRLIIGDKNRGIGYARNILLDACKTKYACWHDSDDISVPHRIQIQAIALDLEQKPNLIFCDWIWLIKYSNEKWIHKDKPNPATQAFATLLFPVDKTVKFNGKLKLGGEDWNWIKEMQKKYPIEVTLSDVLYKVRYHNDRIGTWKRKLRKEVPKEILGKLSYKELIEYYKENIINKRKKK